MSADYYTYRLFNYHPDGRIRSLTSNSEGAYYNVSYTYDEHNRVSSKRYYSNDGYSNTVTYEYLKVGDEYTSIATSPMVSRYTTRVNTNIQVYYTYTYDGKGNITSISLFDTEQYRYVYDELSRLVREDNIPQNKTIVYNYDNAGNILSVKTRSKEEADPNRRANQKNKREK